VAQVKQVAANTAVLLDMTGREQAREKLHGKDRQDDEGQKFEQERVVKLASRNVS
jgi:hypothetical protein